MLVLAECVESALPVWEEQYPHAAAAAAARAAACAACCATAAADVADIVRKHYTFTEIEEQLGGDFDEKRRVCRICRQNIYYGYSLAHVSSSCNHTQVCEECWSRIERRVIEQ